MSHRDAFGTRANTPVAPAFTTFPSAMKEGFIGISADKPVDNPFDNIFHIMIDRPLQGNEKVWLVYQLDGVTHHTGISKSVNDQLASGGYFVQEHEGWKEQWEQIDASWLKQGDNVIRFTTPEGAGHGYRIRDLKVKIAREEVVSGPEIIINQPDHYSYYDGSAYINGFIKGTEDARLFVDGKETPLFKGRFETIVEIHDMDHEGVWKVNLEARYGDGESICRQVKFTTSATADHTYSYNAQVAYNEKLFYEQCGDFIALDGAGLTVDDISLKENAMISITGLRTVDIAALDAGMTNVTGKSKAYRFLPHGTVFENEVRVRMAFDKDKIPDGYTAQDVRTYFFDEESHHWVPLKVDTVLEDKGEIISFTTHFTDMINGVIQVPESPEANAYNSTSMKGIKAANPTAAVNLIQPPQANNTGNAGLSYPLNLPAGRAGMQPQLAISYNSGGGNGWMGLGWNLNIPAVTIDTRWGVPRFDPNNETETYSLNGEQLSPVAHREIIPREADRRFYPRVEGAFNKIIRHGDNPAEYYWEVIDKSGTRYFYGGTRDGLDKGAVLNFSGNNIDPGDSKFSNENIAHWALAEVVDLNGNFVKYHYSKQEDTGLTEGAVSGYEIYLDKVTYTGHSGEEGLYSVVFTRDKKLDTENRKDVTIDARLGFKRVTAHLLKKIEVKFEGKNIRHYELKYEEGAFYKALLKNIEEYDAVGSHFNTHEFDYFNELYDNETNTLKRLYEEKATDWTVPNDSIQGMFSSTNDETFSGKASVLSGTHTKSKGFGIAAGIGFDEKAFLKTNTITVSGGTSGSESSGMVSFLDMNGDGLPDKVFVGKNKTLYYSANESGPDVKTIFADAKKIHIRGIDNFYKEESRAVSLGLNAQFGSKKASAYVSAGENFSLSTTSVYISEVNGDGLPDIVANGQVYFNTIDPDTGDLIFVDESSETLSPIGVSASMDGELMPVIEHDEEAVKAKNPLQDMVRMWVAPYDGEIEIDAPVQMLLPDDGELEANADGVKVSVQLEDNPLWKKTIEARNVDVHSPVLTNIKVKKGNQLFFRLQSVENGSNDSVSWAPVITYLDEELEGTDANNKPQHQFSIADDYLITADQDLSIALDGTVKLEGTFHKPVTSDDVIILVTRERNEIIDTLAFKNFAWDEETSYDLNESVAVDSADNVKFKVLTTTNIDWNGFEWEPYVYYTSTADDTPVIDDQGRPLLDFYPIPLYSLYSGLFEKTVSWAADSADTVSVSPLLFFENDETTGLPPDWLNGTVIFSVKKRNELIRKDTIEITEGMANGGDPIEAIIAEEEELYFEYHFKDSTLANNVRTAQGLIKVDTVEEKADAGVFYAKRDIKFGPLYRGWGHFGYNGNGTRAGENINRGDLKISNQMKNANEDDYKDIEDPDDLESDNMYDPKKENFFILVPFGKEKVWNGTDQFTRLNGQMMQSSRFGTDDVKPPVFNVGNGGGEAFGVNKISLSSSTSLSGGLSASFTGGNAGAGISKSFGPTNVLLDFMDMNGDRYPDVVGMGRVQYSQSQGGLSSFVREHGFKFNHRTHTESIGASLSGSAVSTEVKPKSWDIKNVTVEVGSGRNSAGLNGNYAAGENTTDFTYMDINGDGLPDRVKNDFENPQLLVQLNLGYKFDSEVEWVIEDVPPVPEGFKIDRSFIQSGNNTSIAGGGGVSVAHGSISAGVNFSRSDNYALNSMQDVNGDGLVDLLVKNKDGNVSARLNLGNRFGPVIPLTGIHEISQGTGTSFGLNAAFTAGVTLPIGIKITVNPSVNSGTSVSRELVGFRDVDGDGFSDYVTSNADNQLSVRRSTIGKTNKLKTVKRPLGATFTLNYERTGNTFKMPNSAWVLNEVKVFDGYKGDGIDSMRTTFAYENGYHDRYEREFYGFEKVITTTWNKEEEGEDQKFKPYSRVTQTFNNDTYYEKGLLLTEVMTEVVIGGEDKVYIEKKNEYDLKVSKDTEGTVVWAFPMLKETKQWFYEGEDDAGKFTRMTYTYDSYGRVKEFTDFGDEGEADNISSTITYHEYLDDYLLNAPRSIEVFGTERTYRKREADIDSNTGNVTQIRQHLEGEAVAVYDLEYDAYGNLEKITRPANEKGERLSLSYVYDKIVHSYVEEVTNSYGYTSSAEYDFSFGQVLKSIDINGNEISYELDNLGRVSKITGPYEKAVGAPYTIDFIYHPNAETPWAQTNHYDPAHPGNDLVTAIFVDGLGRVLQTKKDAAIFQKDGAPDKEQMIASGRVFFDALGRTTKAYYPVIDASGTPGDLIEAHDTGVAPTSTSYDVLNRVLLVTLPDQSTTKTAYGFGTDRNGKLQFSTKTTDANGIATEQFTDVKGRVTAVKNAGNIWTSFTYNAMSEQVKATDPKGNSTISKYDWFGRRTSRIHPDAGETIYKYDLAGNLTELITANLSQSGGAIQYKYDHERLTDILYPDNPENDVRYEYGQPGESENRAGRIKTQVDASGSQDFYYGPLGEILKNVRTIVIPRFEDQTYTTEWKYDTWNRLTEMTYPDGEKVEYTYNVGGLLRSMRGKKKGTTYNYVDQLGYDKFEQRLFLAYGNGTKTTYDYEPDRRRLKNMVAKTASGRAMMDNVYEYDAVNNIKTLTNNAPIPTSNLMGGSSEYSYEYDELYRLTAATGSFKGTNQEHQYSLGMEYNAVGGITQKTQTHQRKSSDGNSWKEQKKTTYDMGYAYGNSSQPNTPTHIGDKGYTYDANGNQTGWTHDVSGQRRQVMWDEENRIRAIYDNGAAHHYTYDASGTRVLKGKSNGQAAYVNGEWTGGSGSMGNYTVYVNPYIVLKSGGYSKHYYIEGQRIVSKLGDGLGDPTNGSKAGNGTVSYGAKQEEAREAIVKNLKFLGQDGSILTAGNSGKTPPGQISTKEKGGGKESEQFQYFYHPDHLGSTSYITDASGEVYQHLEYFAFGETFVEEHSNSDRTPYLFNGKELDEETGLYYYGARYYDPQTSIFQSVDRFAEKYLGLSPYSYAANNPINYIDVNGDSVWVKQTRIVAKNGDITLNNTIHITGKVLKTGTGSSTSRDVASGLNARLNAQSSTKTSNFNGGNTITVNTTIAADFKSASSMSDVSDTDHLLVLVDNVKGKTDPKLGGGEAAGVANRPGQIGYIESQGAVETAFHEVGHMLGLPHPNSNNSSDPMSYTGRGANFSSGQMSTINNNATRGLPNSGSNSVLMNKAFPRLRQGSFNTTTTSGKPFQIAPAQNARIPLPIKR